MMVCHFPPTISIHQTNATAKTPMVENPCKNLMAMKDCMFGMNADTVPNNAMPNTVGNMAIFLPTMSAAKPAPKTPTNNPAK